MAATRGEISDWFDRGIAKKATHMIVVHDTFDHDDYPVFVSAEENVYEKKDIYERASMQRVMEVYKLSVDKQTQLSQPRSFNY
jgi:hypothetical protein